MKWIIWVSCACCLLMGLGCATTQSPRQKEETLQHAHYVPYVGVQQNWPLAPDNKAIILTAKSNIPIYISLPIRPYAVLGMIDISHDSNDSVARQAANAARAAGADAVLACSDPVFTAAHFQVGVAFRSNRQGKRETKLDALRAILIRWK